MYTNAFQGMSRVGYTDYQFLCHGDTRKINYGNDKIDGLPRGGETSRVRWNKYILPILKTHSLQLPGFPDNYYSWMDEVLTHIVHENVNTFDDIDFHHLLRHVCPGQTIASVKHYVQNVNRENSGEPLHVICNDRMNNPKAPKKSYLTTEGDHGTRGRLPKNALRIARIREIVQVYKEIFE